MKSKAFTLVELMVVISIIAILAVGSITSYESYLMKSRDSKRIQILQNAIKIMETESLNKGKDDQYLLVRDEIVPIFENYGTELLGEESGYCFIYLGVEANILPFANGDNEYIIATWGERTSTENPGESGLLYVGSSLAVKKMKDTREIWIESFKCGNWQIALDNNNYWHGGNNTPRMQFRRTFFDQVYNSVDRFWSSSLRPRHVEMTFTSLGGTLDSTVLCRHQAGIAQSCISE